MAKSLADRPVKKSKSTTDIYGRVLTELYLINRLSPGKRYATLFVARGAQPSLAEILKKLTDSELNFLLSKIENIL